MMRVGIPKFDPNCPIRENAFKISCLHCSIRTFTAVKKSLKIALCIISISFFTAPNSRASEDQQLLELKPHDHIILIVNTFFERMQDAGYFETLLHSSFPEKELVVPSQQCSAGC